MCALCQGALHQATGEGTVSRRVLSAPVPADPVQRPLRRSIVLACHERIGGDDHIIASQQRRREVTRPVRPMVERRAQLRRLLVDLVNPLLRLHEASRYELPAFPLLSKVCPLQMSFAPQYRQHLRQVTDRRKNSENRHNSAHHAERADNRGTPGHAAVCAVNARLQQLVLCGWHRWHA